MTDREGGKLHCTEHLHTRRISKSWAYQYRETSKLMRECVYILQQWGFIALYHRSADFFFLTITAKQHIHLTCYQFDQSSSNSTDDSKRETEHTESETENDIKTKILEASLPFVHELGWTKNAISAGTYEQM